MTETQIKLKLIRFLITSHPNSIIASEMNYDFGNRRADIVLLDQTNLLYAYEIKSINDNTSRILTQTTSYKSFFDFCYIVCEEENLKYVRKATPKDIGLIVVSQNNIKEIRKSKQFKQQSKMTLASVLPTNQLRKLSTKTGKSQIELANLVANQFTKNELKLLSRSYIRCKYNENNKLLMKEIGKELTSDDLLLISSQFPSRLFTNVS